jgi:hypothetical protein
MCVTSGTRMKRLLLLFELFAAIFHNRVIIKLLIKDGTIQQKRTLGEYLSNKET